jgi:hypothetical protein
MSQNFGRLLRSAATATALAGALAAPLAQAATVIDFEPAALTGLYLPADTFSQGEYTLTTLADFGLIDTAAALGGVSPTGNATQFYFNSNDGSLAIARTDAGSFSLEGFSSAFVPLDPASAQTTVLVAMGTKLDNSQVAVAWTFAPSLTSHYAFSVHNAAPEFTAFTGLKQVVFKACSWDGVTACAQPTLNNGQFAIDDITLSAAPVPEASTSLMLTLGLIGLGLGSRRFARRVAR